MPPSSATRTGAKEQTLTEEEQVEQHLRSAALLRDKVENLKQSIKGLEKIVDVIESRGNTKLSNISDEELIDLVREAFPIKTDSNGLRLVSSSHEPSDSGSGTLPPVSISQIVAGLLPSAGLEYPRPHTNPATKVRAPTFKVPSIVPLEVSDPFPYLQRFTSLSLSSAMSVKVLHQYTPPKIVHSHVLVCHAPHFVFSVVIRVDIAVETSAISETKIEYVPGWVKSEIGLDLERIAKKNDVEVIFHVLNQYWSLLIHRAYCWAVIADSREEDVLSYKSYIKNGDESATPSAAAGPVLLPDPACRPMRPYDGNFTSDTAYMEALLRAFDRDGFRQLLTMYQLQIRHPTMLRPHGRGNRTRDKNDNDGMYYDISWLPRLEGNQVGKSVTLSTMSPVIKENIKIDEAHARFTTHFIRTLHSLDCNLPNTIAALYDTELP